MKRSSSKEENAEAPTRQFRERRPAKVVTPTTVPTHHKKLKRSTPRKTLKKEGGQKSRQKSNDPNKLYYVERVLDHKKNGRQFLYLVKWHYYHDSENTWEPTENFEQKDCLRDYWRGIAPSVDIQDIPADYRYLH